MEDNKLKTNIQNVLNSKSKENLNQKKNISDFVKSENDRVEKKCKSCMDIKKKITPLVYISIFIMFFTVYGFVSVINKILDYLFTQ